MKSGFATPHHRRQRWLPIARVTILGISTAGIAYGQTPTPTLPVARQVEPEQEVVVTDVRPALRGAETRLLAREAALAAGNQGDAAKVVASLPGVATPGALGEPVVWGSAPRETGIFLDRVPLPALFHGSALRSVVPTGLLSTVQLTPGAYGVELGRFLGGTLELETTNDVPFDRKLTASVDALDVAASTEFPLGDRGGAYLTARYGVIDRWLPQWLGAPANQLYTIPSYVDASGVALFTLSNGDTLKVAWLTSHDSSSRSNEWARDENRRHFTRLYAVHEHYARNSETTSRTRLTPYLGADVDSSATQSVGTRSGQKQRSFAAGLRADTTVAWRGLQVGAGVDARYEQVSASKVGSLTVPPREGDPRVFGLAPGRDEVVDHVALRRVQAAPYVTLDAKLGALRVSPGLRLETSMTDLDRAEPSSAAVPDTGAARFETAWLPRLSAAWQWSQRLTWFSAWSRHVQPPAPEDLGVRSGRPALPFSRATHWVVGQTAQLTPAWSVQLVGFRKWMSHLAVRSADVVPRPAALLENTGRGDVWGAQALLQLRSFAGWSGWFALTLSASFRSEPRFPSRRFDYDQPLVATWVVNKAVAPWSFGARLRLASGFPRSAVVGSYNDLQLGRYTPILSRTGWWRLPPLVALDLRAERHFSFLEGNWFVYAELLNATDHDNVEDVSYSRDYSQRRYLLGLPALAFLGLRAEL